MSSFQPESLPGLESPTISLVVDVAAMSEQIAANAQPVIYEDRTSEAARDQGHGPVERHAPIEDEDHPRRKPENIATAKAANERRRRRYGNHETRFSDAGRDLARDGNDQEDITAVSPRITLGLGHAIARHTVDIVDINSIKNKTGEDTVLGRALLRAHQEKRST